MKDFADDDHGVEVLVQPKVFKTPVRQAKNASPEPAPPYNPLRQNRQHLKVEEREDNVLLQSPNVRTAPPEQPINEQIIHEQNKDAQAKSRAASEKRVEMSECSPQYSPSPIQLNQSGLNSRVSKFSDSQNAFEINPQRIVGGSAPTGKTVKKHRIIILGSENVGKTSLFLRYMYFDKSKAIDIRQTPGKDGHIFSKRITG